MTSQFCDLSEWNPATIDWQAYKAWSASGDGISRVALRSSYGVGYQDAHFAAYRAGALAAGIDCILFYHYSYPSVNSAQQEANSQFAIVGSIRPQDLLILDFEENVPQATSEWAYEWLAQQEYNYGKFAGLYASSAYIASRLQDTRIAKYPLWLANWEFTPDERPPVPYPWTSYEFVQFTDKATNIPGINGNVDANIFLGLGGNTPMNIPAGWADDGTTLTAPNGHHVIQGFRVKILTSSNWDPSNVPLEEVQAASPVEDYYPSAGGTRQLFNFCELAWTSTRGVYVVGIGNELLGCRKERDKLKALLASSNLGQIGTLAKQITDDIALIQKLSQVQ